MTFFFLKKKFFDCYDIYNKFLEKKMSFIIYSRSLEHHQDVQYLIPCIQYCKAFDLNTAKNFLQKIAVEYLSTEQKKEVEIKHVKWILTQEKENTIIIISRQETSQNYLFPNTTTNENKVFFSIMFPPSLPPPQSQHTKQEKNETRTTTTPISSTPRVNHSNLMSELITRLQLRRDQISDDT